MLLKTVNLQSDILFSFVCDFILGIKISDSIKISDTGLPLERLGPMFAIILKFKDNLNLKEENVTLRKYIF